ncbi:hypothetical protein XENOCAPTIV_006761, partial [Xenoophorus captivus]
PLAVRVSPQVEVKAQGSAVEFTCSAAGGVDTRIEWLKEALPKVMINVRTSMQTVMVGNSVEFECHAVGDPEPTVRWSKVGGPLPSHIMVKGSMLRIDQATEADAGHYRCTATNDEPLSYLTLPTIKNAYKAFNIKINFRPDNVDGMILYNGQRRTTGADFISLGLVSGRLEFRSGLE